MKCQTVGMSESTSSPKRTPGRRPPRQRPAPGRASGPVVELASIETPPELILFNAYLAAEKDLERERQRVRQAEAAKDKAAARLKDLTSSGAPRDEVAAAEQEYREQVESLRRVRAGEADAPVDGVDADGTAGDVTDDAAGEDVSAGESAEGEPGDEPEAEPEPEGEAVADADAASASVPDDAASGEDADADADGAADAG